MMLQISLLRKLSTETPSRLVNQFPNEAVLTVKDMLAALSASEKAIAISGPGGEAFDIPPEEGKQGAPLSCAWYPVTFNLLYELSQFVAFFQRQQAEEDDRVSSSFLTFSYEAVK